MDESIINQHMKKLDLDKMDEDDEDHPRHHGYYDDSSERSIITDEDDEMDEDMIPGSSGRGQRMSGFDEEMFEMR